MPSDAGTVPVIADTVTVVAPETAEATEARIEAETDRAVEIIEAESDATVARIEAEGEAAARVAAIGVQFQAELDQCKAELASLREQMAMQSGLLLSISDQLAAMQPPQPQPEPEQNPEGQNPSDSGDGPRESLEESEEAAEEAEETPPAPTKRHSWI